MNNNSIEITKTNSDCAQYTGTVTVSTYLGDYLIQKETHHNAGLQTLFEFMGSCLQGNWYEAQSKRPCKLVLLQLAPGERVTDNATEQPPPNLAGGWSRPNNINAIDNQGNHFWGSRYTVCNPVMYDTAAVAETSATSSSVTYHFRIPFLSLIGGSEIKKLLLLPETTSSYQTEACAYFVLKNAIKVPTKSANFTIIIDWSLTFTNQS